MAKNQPPRPEAMAAYFAAAGPTVVIDLPAPTRHLEVRVVPGRHVELRDDGSATVREADGTVHECAPTRVRV